MVVGLAQFLVAVVTAVDGAEFTLQPGVALRLASVEEGRKVMATRDAYTKAMSPFDRAVHMRTGSKTTQEDYLRFAAEQVLAWTDEEAERLREAVASAGARLDTVGLQLGLPATVPLIKTTGRDQADAPYCRANSMVVPRAALALPLGGLERAILHELFHIWSRNNPRLRDRLYRIIGFERRGEIPFPAELRPRKVTNPDAPRNEHTIEVTHGGKPLHVAPILFSQRRFDAKARRPFFSYLTLEFLVVEARGPKWVAARVEGKPRLLDVWAVSGLFKKIGRNTRYIIHPEEILADNFVLLLTGEKDVPTPRILAEMRKVLAGRVVYSCPLHPPVRAAKPGKCPLCRMDLRPKRIEE